METDTPALFFPWQPGNDVFLSRLGKRLAVSARTRAATPYDRPGSSSVSCAVHRADRLEQGIFEPNSVTQKR